MNSPAEIESRLRDRGVIKREEFRTSTEQLPANCKVEMDVMYQDPDLVDEIVGYLAVKLSVYRPQVIVPVPVGANRLGLTVAAEMGVNCVILNWANKDAKQLRYFDELGRAQVEKARVAAIIEDATRTDGNINVVADFLGRKRQLVAGVVWDRSDPSIPKITRFPVERIIERYVPLRVDE